MAEKLVVGPINKGIRTDREPFVIDNDSFPDLENAYQWRGRIKRKRGTQFLSRLERYFNSSSVSYSSSSTFNLVAGAGNILTGFSLQATGNIVPGSVTIVDTTAANTYTEPATPDGTLIGTSAGTGTINYATGAITITGGAAHAVSATFLYYPGLPVMGLEDLVLSADEFPGTIAFDTVYSYVQQATNPYATYDVSFYKNLATGTYPDYVQKTNWTPTSWNGQNYQQFWTTNFQEAFWATNGISVPFTTTNIGMQYKAITTVNNITGGPPALADLTIPAHGLVVGDFVFINEVLTTTGINLQTGYVTGVVSANKVTVEFPNATIANNGTGGIAQYLTNRSDPTKDCLRWYDGDPTNANPTSPSFVLGDGWVNFMPPLSNLVYSISGKVLAIYYLVGARMIVPFKGFLLFFGPVIQTSSPGSQVYLQDTIIWSQRGTPYYTASFTGSVTSAATDFNPILTPFGYTAAPNAFFEDVTGFGGFAEIVNAQPITSVGNNEDVLIVGGTNYQKRIVYNGNIITPFDSFTINSELGTGSTFSAVTMDRGVFSVGGRGIIITSQIGSQRIDLEIPDSVFEFNLLNNGTERVCAQRDFVNEWIYFTYLSNRANSTYIFPNQTLQYNYRDDSWAIFNESYTTYGQFRKVTGDTWATIGNVYPTWEAWNVPWDDGESTLLQPQVIAGNGQGFVLVRGEGTGEGTSLSITSFSGNTVTSPNHCLNDNDFILIQNCIGAVGYQVNGQIFQVGGSTQNTFTLSPNITAGAYVGNGTITRIYNPYIQTKQFPMSWGNGRKTRLGPQMYLLEKTTNSQISLLIFLSQNSSLAYNLGPIVPAPNSTNNALVYSTILYTCPESTNLGLTPANINLNMVTASDQQQIWHRINTSLLGDTVQLGFTMSSQQITALSPTGEAFAITGATQANPCVLTCAGAFSVNALIQITGVVGMTQLNFNPSLMNPNYYTVLSSTSTTVTIGVDSTAFTAYSSGGSALQFAAQNAFEEIVLHGFVIDVSASQVLA